MEHEADRVADQIMRAPDRGPPSIPAAPPQISRRRVSRAETDEQTLRPKGAAAEPAAAAGEAPASVGEVLRAPGHPLDTPTRSFFEERFGDDFSHVRVHTDAQASESARALHARAYTVGRDVVFAAGQYQPHADSGRHLLAHELAHTVQQAGEANPTLQRKVEVNPGVTLDTLGYNTTKTGNVYSAPAVVKASIWNEIFTGLFANDWVFKLLGTTSQEANANLKQHMAARYGVADFAAKKQYRFETGTATEANEDFWTRAPGTAHGWKPKEGVSPEKAAADLNVHPKKYAIACAMATRYTLVGGGGPGTDGRPATDQNDWIPGDAGYIQNNDAISAKKPGYEGENIIYVGQDRFWGHMSGVVETKTLAQWVKFVTGWGGATPTVEDSREYPSVGLDPGGIVPGRTGL